MQPLAGLPDRLTAETRRSYTEVQRHVERADKLTAWQWLVEMFERETKTRKECQRVAYSPSGQNSHDPTPAAQGIDRAWPCWLKPLLDHGLAQRYLMTSATNRALNVSELLYLTFSCLQVEEKDVLLDAACVCKCWSSIALDVLYETMDIRDILLPLAETEAEDDGTRKVRCR